MGRRLLDLGVGDVSAAPGPVAVATKRPKKVPRKKARRVRVSADLGHGGRLSVRHMSERGLRLESTAIALADGADDAKPVWIQLAKPGDFLGHHAGPFSLNDKVFREIIANFEATENRSIPIDMDHASEGEPHPVHGAPAHGWITDMKIEGGNLWGLVEWLPKTREAIRAKQFKFLSPAVVLKSKDRVTGKPAGARLSSAAITNRPFLDGMQPLAASDRPGTLQISIDATFAHAPDEYMPALKAALRMNDLATATDCVDALDQVRTRYDDRDDAPADGVDLGGYMRPLRDAVNAKPGATWDEVFDTAEDLLVAAMSDRERTETYAEDPDGDGDGETHEGDTDMNVKEDAVALSEAKAQNAEISLKLSETTGKLNEATTKLSEASAKIAKLEADAATYAAEKNAARVEEAFETYKDKKNLTEADRENMAIILSASPEKFEKAYPRLKANERFLQRNLTTARDANATTTDDRDAGADASFAATRARLMRENPKMSYADASEKALQLRQTVRSVG